MFVGMWMSRNPVSIGAETTVDEAAALMRRHRIRRLPVVGPTPEGARLIGIVTGTDILHAFPADLNPLSAVPRETLPARERDSHGEPVRVSDVMTRDPVTTSPNAPMEAAARVMRDRKIGALPVLKEQELVGLITESDIFRAFVAIFGSDGRGARITFGISSDEDVFPLLCEIAQHHGLRIVNVISVLENEQPVCVVQVAGHATDRMLDDIWRSRHRVLHVVRLPLE